ncbi:hypothetical protein Tco_1485529 [Tanacetum coccineum]
MASFNYHLNPLYTIKGCSSCGAFYTTDYCCSKGGLIDKIIREQPPQNCATCGDPVDGLYCRPCAFLRKCLNEGWFTIHDKNEILNTLESSNDDTNVGPPDSLIMKDEHLDTIPTTESDEVIESSVENLVPIPNDILREKLLNVNLLIANIEALKDNPTPSSDFWQSHFFSDYSLTDHGVFYFDDDHIEENSSGSTTTHSDSSLYKYDSFIFDLSIDPFPPADRSDVYHEQFADELGHIISPPEYDHFYFKIKPELGNLTMDVVDDIFDKLTREPRVQCPNLLSSHPTLYLDLITFFSSDSLSLMLYGFFFLFSRLPGFLRPLGSAVCPYLTRLHIPSASFGKIQYPNLQD